MGEEDMALAALTTKLIACQERCRFFEERYLEACREVGDLRQTIRQLTDMDGGV